MNNCTQITPIAKAIIHPEDDDQVALEYAVRCIVGPEGETLYGLRVDKRSLAGVLIEREETPGLTGSMDEATVLAETFAAGTVPPCVLLEMVADYYVPVFTVPI